MSESFLEKKLVATVSQTDIGFSQKVASAAGQTFDITAVMSPEKFSDGEFSPTMRYFRELYKKGKNFDHSKAFNGFTIYLIKTAGAYQVPEKMVARVGMAAWSFKKVYGADKVVVIATDLDYGRAERGPDEDKRVMGYMNSIEWLANIWKTSGVDQVVSIHLHNPKIKETFQKVFDNKDIEAIVNINPVYIYADYLRSRSALKNAGKLENFGKDIVYLSLDDGAYPMTKQLYDIMASIGMKESKIVRFKKSRSDPNDPNKVVVELVGEYPENILDGKEVVLLDDIVDTGGSLIKNYKWIDENYSGHKLGKPNAYTLIFTHAALGGEAYLEIQRRISENIPKIREFIVSNSRPYIDDHIDNHRFKTFTTIIRIAKTFGDIIKAGLETSKAIEDRHKNLFNENMLYGNIYDIKRSQSYGSIVGVSLPEGFVKNLNI